LFLQFQVGRKLAVVVAGIHDPSQSQLPEVVLTLVWSVAAQTMHVMPTMYNNCFMDFMTECI
jgi:hypothetical protein